MDPVVQRGLHIALMGIDGAGKTTLATALRQSLESRGLAAEIVGWKQVLRAGAPLTASVLGHVSMLSYKCQYALATGAECPIDMEQLLAGDSLPAFFPKIERRLQTMRIERNAPDLFLCSALFELAGNIFLHSMHVDAALRAGRVVIDESFGFKHVLKNVLMTLRLSPEDSHFRAVARSILDVASQAFGTLLRPTRGFWIDTDPALALRWRVAGTDSIVSFEDYGLVGDREPSSFVALQTDCRHAFAEAARDWQWTRIEMLDRTAEDNVRDAVITIERDIFGS